MTQPKDTKEIIAAFDFDGTMTYKDSLVSFLTFAVGHLNAYAKLLLSFPYILGFLLGIKSRQEVKEAVLRRFFFNTPDEQLRKVGIEFAKLKLNRMVIPEAMERLNWHLMEGHRCFLVSANLSVYLEPWAKSHGFEATIASLLKIDEKGKITGQLEGANCWGPEKCRRLEEIIGPKKNYILYAYGDSRGDKELLNLADFPYYREMPLPG